MKQIAWFYIDYDNFEWKSKNGEDANGLTNHEEIFSPITTDNLLNETINATYMVKPENMCPVSLVNAGTLSVTYTHLGSTDSCVSGSQRLQRKVIDKAVYSCGRKRQERNVAFLSLYH